MHMRGKHIALPKATGVGRDRDNSVALINIVFLLLVFMMLAGTLRPPLPAGFKWAETREPGAKSRPYGDVFVDRDGKLWKEGTPLDLGELAGLASARARHGGAMRLLVDRAVEAQVLSTIANLLRDQGLARIDLTMTRAPRGPTHSGGASGQP